MKKYLDTYFKIVQSTSLKILVSIINTAINFHTSVSFINRNGNPAMVRPAQVRPYLLQPGGVWPSVIQA